MKDYINLLAVCMWLSACLFYPWLLLLPVVAFIVGQAFFCPPETLEERIARQDGMRGLMDNALGYPRRKRIKTKARLKSEAAINVWPGEDGK